jgi:hypothetical protein
MEASLTRQKYTVRLLYKKVITTVLKQTIFYLRGRLVYFPRKSIYGRNIEIFHAAAAGLI